MTRTRKPTRRRKPAYTPVATVNTIEVPPDSPLTTKEGWAAFVRHTPQPPQSLTASPLMAMSPKDRARHEDRLRDYHADLPLVNTPTIQKVISTGRLLIQLNRRQISARRGMVISGMSGTGKTTALTQLGRAHELAIRRRFPDDGDRLPVIYVTVPPAATPRMLAVEFARFLGLEFPARANVTDITDAVCSVAAHTRVDLVLVDEIHNISLATRAGAEVSDQLKYFAGCPRHSSMPGSKSRRKDCSPAPAAARSLGGSPSSRRSRSPTALPSNARTGTPWSPPWNRRCGCATTSREHCPKWPSSSTAAAAA
jgi:hypothetical protein